MTGVYSAELILPWNCEVEYRELALANLSGAFSRGILENTIDGRQYVIRAWPACVADAEPLYTQRWVIQGYCALLNMQDVQGGEYCLQCPLSERGIFISSDGRAFIREKFRLYCGETVNLWRLVA